MYSVTKDFMGKPAPPNYVAGLGRGAIGFTTRSDIGPARDSADQPTAAPEEDRPENYNENEEGLFAGGSYDKEDEEADLIYQQVDQKMENRRKKWREKRELEETLKRKKQPASIHEQFSDLKEELGKVSEEDWINIPEPGDFNRKQKKKLDAEKRQQAFVFAPDSLVLERKAQLQTQSSLDVKELADFQHFQQINRAKEDLLKVKLDQSQHLSSESTIDPKGYLTGLNSIQVKTAAEIGDMKKARELLLSVTSTNPKHAPGWIAAARLEELDGKFPKARQLIDKGCLENPKSEEIWLEAARLHLPEQAKSILATAIINLPTSVPLWLKAMELEQLPSNKKRVIKNALKQVPNSLLLWKTAVELEEDQEDAKLLLESAVEMVPDSVELWLALSKISPHIEARKVLNKARVACPTSLSIWLAACQLEEANGQSKEIVERILNRSMRQLSNQGVRLTRELWLDEAKKMEKQNSLLTCQVIVEQCLSIDVDEEDEEDLWLQDAKTATAQEYKETARFIYRHLLNKHSQNSELWHSFAAFEKQNGTFESLVGVLKEATDHCPEDEILWLKWAKEVWMSKDVEKAREILQEAFKANPNKEGIWLAAAKLEVESGYVQDGKMLLVKAREKADTKRVWLKSIVLERNLENYEEALKLLEQALTKFPDFPKFWMIRGQILTTFQPKFSSKFPKEPREHYQMAVKQCPNSVSLWLLAAEYEANMQQYAKARALLDRAKIQNPKQPELWLASVELELKDKNPSQANALLATALQQCPQSGLLWFQLLKSTPRSQQKSKLADAVKQCPQDPWVLLAASIIFIQERQLEKANSWLKKALSLDSDLGDIWAWLYKFQKQFGPKEQVQEVLEGCKKADPRHGRIWVKILKDPKNWKCSTEEILEKSSQQLSVFDMK